eukprot:m.97730 g.97730  ORF g.97730 m.97730 type:complete len:152 (+) comp13611_c0_seq1:2662-3117(+)
MLSLAMLEPILMCPFPFSAALAVLLVSMQCFALRLDNYQTGVGNGDPTCHERNKATWRTTYHGLCRAIVQVTAHSSGDFHSRKRISEIDVHGGVRTKILLDENQTQETGEIVVLAVADGFSANISIPVSSDYENSVDVTATHSNKVNIMIP